MEPEDPNATTTTPPAAAETVTPPAEGPKTFTQDQLNAIVGQRLADDRARRSAKPEPKPAPAAPATNSDLTAQIEELQMRNAFDRRVAKLDVPDTTAETMFKLYKVDRPADPVVWFDEMAKAFSLKTPSANQPMNNTNGTAPIPAAASAPAAPNKVDPLTSAGLVDIWNLSPQQLDAMGPQGLREHFEKALQIGHQMSGAPPKPKPGQRK
jgi:hypothetical protein